MTTIQAGALRNLLDVLPDTTPVIVELVDIPGEDVHYAIVNTEEQVYGRDRSPILVLSVQRIGGKFI